MARHVNNKNMVAPGGKFWRWACLFGAGRVCLALGGSALVVFRHAPFIMTLCVQHFWSVSRNPSLYTRLRVCRATRAYCNIRPRLSVVCPPWLSASEHIGPKPMSRQAPPDIKGGWRTFKDMPFRSEQRHLCRGKATDEFDADTICEHAHIYPHAQHYC